MAWHKGCLTCYHVLVTILAAVALAATFVLAATVVPWNFTLSVGLLNESDFVFGLAIWLLVWWILALLWSVIACLYGCGGRKYTRAWVWAIVLLGGPWMIIGQIILLRALDGVFSDLTGQQRFVYVTSWVALAFSYIGIGEALAYSYLAADHGNGGGSGALMSDVDEGSGKLEDSLGRLPLLQTQPVSTSSTTARRKYR